MFLYQNKLPIYLSVRTTTHERFRLLYYFAHGRMPSCVVVLREAHHCRRTKERPIIGRLMAIGIVLSIFTPAEAQAREVRSCPKWEPLIAEYGLPVKWASQVMWRESRCTERVVSKPNSNGTTDIGLMQINSSWRTVTQAICKTKNQRQALRHARCNLAVARYLYSQGGKHHWRTNSGK